MKETKVILALIVRILRNDLKFKTINKDLSESALITKCVDYDLFVELMQTTNQPKMIVQLLLQAINIVLTEKAGN